MQNNGFKNQLNQLNPSDRIRNFSIIAHIDHGKTTLTDRLLQFTNTISEREFKVRLMDSNPIEQERGITIKMAPVRMTWPDPRSNQSYQFNLIDTPGHVDFSYEVSRSLAAAEGVLLVVDATQGVQAQTLANYEKAKAQNLKIIPVINKIDLPVADVTSTTLELMETFGFDEHEIVSVSAKSGQNIEQLLQAIIDFIPSPTEKNIKKDIEKIPKVISNSTTQVTTQVTTKVSTQASTQPLQAMVFTSLYDVHQGVIAYVRVLQGELKRESLTLLNNQQKFTPTEIGFFAPNRTAIDSLQTGEVGYIATGLKDVAQVQTGDTITESYNQEKVQPLPGYKIPQPMVYLDLYPTSGDDFVLLQDALQKLRLHDAALQFIGTHSKALGNGMRIGFLGVLHAEIVQERLEREFDLDLVATAPSVPHEILLTSNEEIKIQHASEYPDPSQIKEIREPMTQTTIFTPRQYLGQVMQLAEDNRGRLLEVIDVGTRVRAVFRLPLAQIIVNFHDQLKSISSGFASMEYQVIGFEAIDAVKLSILVHGEEVEALSQIVVKSQADQIGRVVVKKLKETIPRQQFEVPLQAAIGGHIIARETVKSYRKDVTAKLYGGDRTRRDKLLKKQKAGKKRMKEIGEVQIPQAAFMAVLER